MEDLQYRKINNHHHLDDELESSSATMTTTASATRSTSVVSRNNNNKWTRLSLNNHRQRLSSNSSSFSSMGIIGIIVLASGFGCYCIFLLVGTNNNGPNSAFQKSASSSRTTGTNKIHSSAMLSPNRIWKPHGHLEGDDYSLIADDGLFLGTYQFQHGPYCKNNDDNANCSITFPVEQTNVCTQSSCLVTQRGQKALPPDPNDPDINHDANNKPREVPNQDKVLLVESSTSTLHRDFFLAVLADGHGPLGHASSEIASQELPPRILHAMQKIQQQKPPSKDDEKGDVASLIRTAFLETDRGEISTIPQAGTTAIVVMQWPIISQQSSRLYVASTGDSTAMIIQWKPPLLSSSSSLRKAPTTTSKQQANGMVTKSTETHSELYTILGTAVHHKPGDPIEKARIESKGGFVYIPFNPEESSRVIYTIPGPPRIQMGLAMSRSLGDVDAKRQQLIIPDPDIFTIDLAADEESQYFVILATDGVMDHLQLDEVILPLGKALFEKDETSISLYETCQGILDKAASQWAIRTSNMYRDDMSLVVKKIEFAQSKR